MFPTLKHRQAARLIHRGGVIAYPTEAVFGLGCDPECYEAVERILHLKGRGESAGLILIAATAEQLETWIAPTAREKKNLRKPTPGPVTWVVTATPRVPRWITGDRPTVAVRITTHPIAAALCRAAGMPLVSTSANRHGRPPARTALAVRRQFGKAIDLVVPGATGGLESPTEIRNARTNAILRGGGAGPARASK